MDDGAWVQAAAKAGMAELELGNVDPGPACANAHRPAAMAPGPREHSDGNAGTRDECSEETGLIRHPGTGQ